MAERVTHQESYLPTKPEVVTKLVGARGIDRVNLERNYRFSNDWERKFRLARDLIESGRFTNPQVLVEDFVPQGQSVPQEKATEIMGLKEQLEFMLIVKGVIPTSAVAPEVVQRQVHRELQARPKYQDLVADGWPIEVVGQLLTVDLFSDVDDEKMLEEHRSWVTRGLMRDYLGTLSGKTRRKELTTANLMDRLPDRIFDDPEKIKNGLIGHYLEQRLMRRITAVGLDQGLEEITQLAEDTQDGSKKAFLKIVAERFYDIGTYPFRGEFRSRIQLKGRERTFPSFEQMAFAYDFFNSGTRLLTAETGLGKTGAAFLAMENSQAERVLVVAPAGGKETWMIEEAKLFHDKGRVVVVNGSKDMERVKRSGAKYVVVSQELLGLAEQSPALLTELSILIGNLRIDGAVIDEIDNLSNPRSIMTKTTMRLINQIRQNYHQKTGRPESKAPVLGLTATPIRNKLANLNVAMGLLYPDKYAVSHDESTAGRKTFSDNYLNHPDLAYAALVGERQMFRWEQAEGVQEFQYEKIPVGVSPFEKYLYQLVMDLPTGSLNKIRLLEDCLFNPLLVKAEVRALAKDKVATLDIDRTMGRLLAAVKSWKEIRGVLSPADPGDFLNVDRLVELGYGDLVLECFLSNLLENGVDTMVAEMTKGSQNPEFQELQKFWQNREISSKYSKLRELMEASLTWQIGPEGGFGRQKVFVVSPSRRQGRTGEVEQKMVVSENGQQSLYAPYELDTINDQLLVKKIREWTHGLCKPEDVLLLDGSVSVGKVRDGIIERWVNDPNTAVLVVTLEAAYQSRDFTINVTTDNQGRQIQGIQKLFLAPPWYFQQLKQMAGRSQRQGQLVPVDVRILESEGLVDQGKDEAVNYSYLLSRMALSGIVLSAEEKGFFDSKKVGERISLESADSRYLGDTLGWVRGAGEDRLESHFQEACSINPEVTHAQMLAEKFFDGGKDEYRISGYNADLVAHLARRLTPTESPVLCAGAGTLLLQRKLQRGLDNVDMNPHMMAAGWQLAGQYEGRTIQAQVSRLDRETFPDEAYGLVDYSYAFHWSQPGAERVAILTQVNRVLKQDGVFILTLPEKSLDADHFANLAETMENNFGLKIDRDLSGQSFGKSRRGMEKRLGWCLVARKIGQVNLAELNEAGLALANESGEWVSRGGKNREASRALLKDTLPIAELRLNFDRYEIITQGAGTLVIETRDGAPVKVETKEQEVIPKMPPMAQKPIAEARDLGFLRGGTKEEYLQYRNELLRPIWKMAKGGWGDNEQLEQEISRVFADLQSRNGPISNRLVAYARILSYFRKSREEV